MTIPLSSAARALCIIRFPYRLSCLLMLLTLNAVSQTTIDAVYFGQSHVQKASDAYPTLAGNRETLIKAHVANPAMPASPLVQAQLSLAGNSLTIPLTGPATLPASIPHGPGVVEHSTADTFTAIIPAAWVKPGLTVTVTAGGVSYPVPALNIGAPTKLIMTMTDIHFFELKADDYPAGWETELGAKLPVSSLEVRRAADVVFPELVMPPRGGFPALRVTSKAQYQTITGMSFDGENDASTNWNVALRRAAGRTTGYSLYYLNKYNVPSEGVAGGFSGVGTGTAASRGILLHELGHALSLPHWGDNAAYPYKGAMHGIPAPGVYKETHAGPTWAFHLPTRAFIPCVTQPNNVDGKPPGTYKGDPMQGGGSGFQETGYIFNHFSDYSVNAMRTYLENTVVAWNGTLNSYATWNRTTNDYTNLRTNNGVSYPLQRDQSVISIMASVSGASPSVNMVYPPIGPYTTGLIRLFDPTNATDRTDAQSIFAPANGCDVTLRVTQGGVVKHYMLAASYVPTADPLSGASLVTEAVNLPAANGAITRVDLLLTPDAQINGLPTSPQVLYVWTPAAIPTPNPASFAVAPAAASAYSTTMTATIGTGNSDFNGQMEYLFTETSGNPGGTTSSWQSSPTYTDTGLQPSTTYRYTVTMRSGVSKSQTTTSAALPATTQVGTATVTRLTASPGSTYADGWRDGTWTFGVPIGTIDAEIAPNVNIRTTSAVSTWSGTLLLGAGSSIDFQSGQTPLPGATRITMRTGSAFYDSAPSNLVFPAINLEGGAFLQSNSGGNTYTRTFNGSITGNGGFRTRGNRLMIYSFNQTNPFTGGLVLESLTRHIVEFNAAGAAGLGNVTVPLPASVRSAVIRLGANDVFHPTATLTLNGLGWEGVTDGAYSGRMTRLDMKTYNATVARLIIDGVEQPPGKYTGTALSSDWIDGTGTLTVTGVTPYAAWLQQYPELSFQTGLTQDTDGDLANHLVEFAFGTHPALSDYTSLEWMDDGDAATPGSPVLHQVAQPGGQTDYRLRFMRRKDHGTSGSVAYAWSFTSDLAAWETSSPTPAWYTQPVAIADDPSGKYELVEVPLPAILSNGSKPIFARVRVTAVP